MEKKTYKLIGPDGKPYISDQPGTLPFGKALHSKGAVR